MNIQQPAAKVNWATGNLEGKKVSKTVRKLKHLEGVFADEEAYSSMDPETVVYEVEVLEQEQPGKEGGLLFGTSYLYPGKVGDEYFMTKGHFHEKRDRAEYYWGIRGSGLLLLMDEQGVTTAEQVFPGSLHYVPGHIAHRLVNTGSEVLAVGACWPSDAGHDYGSIADRGFTARVKESGGKAATETG
ncbi:glucose-6-phosphate isomerase [Melghirimyces profundicolus]|uniref:glucose-6-phosphate isomerase n=1 Tax=Melghirimyces profundicolus TaxID=1242148 RepID=A0A2T6C816_9BACL|nr:glucose-6-phosphate isomerase family protein [Melghirimyces profundicolus]PTX64416.1 glucose-6-phosphate isomerase [Melghirimyces profundicolus]